jgi:hypothetical protein
MIRREFIAGLGGAAAAAAIGGSAAWRYVARAPKVVIDDVMVPSSDPGIEIYVRNKRPRASDQKALCCSYMAPLPSLLKQHSI